MPDQPLNFAEVLPPVLPEISQDMPMSKETDQMSRMSRMREWAGKHKGWLVSGAFVASTGLAFTANPASETIHQVEQVVPWVVPGMIVSEAAWIAGAAVCTGAVGNKIPLNPLKIKSQFGEIAQKASDSKTFKAGLILNTAGAVAEFVIPTAAVVTHMPPETWGVLSFSAADLAVTVAVRKAIYNGLQNRQSSQSEVS